MFANGVPTKRRFARPNEAKPGNTWTKRALQVLTTAKRPATPPGPSATSSRRYDVVISFAGEDRASARELAQAMAALELSVFFDDFERTALWGQNLYEYLTDIYQNRGRYCVVLVSKHYRVKRWTQLEWRAIQARCFRENAPYCLPVRIDDTELPGLLPTTGHFSLASDGIKAIAEAVAQKLKTCSGGS